MSVQLALTAFLEDSQAKAQQAELERKNEEITDTIEQNKEATQKSFNEVMRYMRAGYLMISGISRVLGGGMTQVFSSMYMVAMSTIGTYKAITAAIAATGPVGWIQASIMSISLITATSSLISIMAGQRDLSTKIRGVNMALHGISGIIGAFNFK